MEAACEHRRHAAGPGVGHRYRWLDAPEIEVRPNRDGEVGRAFVRLRTGKARQSAYGTPDTATTIHVGFDDLPVAVEILFGPLDPVALVGLAHGMFLGQERIERSRRPAGWPSAERLAGIVNALFDANRRLAARP